MSQPSHSALTLAENTVSSLFPKAALLPAPKVAAAISLDPGVVRRQICEGRFPMPIVKIGRLNFVPRPGLVKYLADQFLASGMKDPEPPPKSVEQIIKRGRGRPPKLPPGERV